MSSTRRIIPPAPMVLALAVAVNAGCGPVGGEHTLAADVPLHLEAALASAEVSGSSPPADRPIVEWIFDGPQPDWKPLRSAVAPTMEPEIEQADGALRVRLDRSNAWRGTSRLQGAVYVDLPDWRREDWDHLLIRARASGAIARVVLGFNLGSRTVPGTEIVNPFLFGGSATRVIGDGVVHTYRLPADRSWEGWGEWEDPWRELVLILSAAEPAVVEILSVTAVSKAATYGDAAGVSNQVRQGDVRQVLYMHAPGSLDYRVRVPPNGRLDFGLGVLKNTDPVTFRVTAATPGDERQLLFEETYSDKERWAQRSVDLTQFAGEIVQLALEAASDRDGTVALWTTPTLSGPPAANRPNVVLYAVDGLGAEYMSLYGFNLNTTPNLERIAAEGAVFERAYSNARWTTPGTMALMTSLQHSVLGGFQRERVQLPERVVTMAQHYHRAGYQTAVLTGNTSAARTAGLDREVDMLRDAYIGDASSIRLQAEFWRWRETFPGQPYWIHFQMTDVWFPGGQEFVGPFEGLYVSAERRNAFVDWRDELREDNPGHWWRPSPEAFENAGIDPVAYSEAGQKLYAEAVAHQDEQIGRFVDQLKAAGEWENTIFIVTADHGQHEAGLVMVDPPIPDGHHTHIRPEHTWIPLLVAWPGHIPGGQRFRDPVSLIDVLPTVLELAGLPPAQAAQGRSLAPLLLGAVPESEWEARPVILDEFYVDPESGQLGGWIEVVDGRWGASLEINPPIQPVWARRGEYDDARGERPAPLLLYDLWSDPYCLNPVNDEHPTLVEKYAAFLTEQFEAHRALAEHIGAAGEELVLTPEQLETLRALGYIQ